MNAKPTLARAPLLTSFVAALLATVITLGTLGGITTLMLRNGMPMERLVTAEHACAEHAYVSDREACMRHWLDAGHAPRVASQ